MTLRSGKLVIAAGLLAMPMVAPSTPPSQPRVLILNTGSVVRSSSHALQVVQRNAAYIALGVRRTAGSIGYISIALPNPTDNWKDGQLPPQQVQFLFKHGRLIDLEPNSKRVLPSSTVAAIAVPMVKANSSYQLVKGRIVVRTLVQTSESSEVWDANGRLVRRHETVRHQPIYATDLLLLVDRTGRIFM
jgi:hypothetical protein